MLDRLRRALEPSPARLRRAALAALATNVLIVFTGGIVRVTGSGLGCPTWPTCDGVTIAPRPGGDHAGWQSAIEFGNRLLTFVVLAAALAAWWYVRRSRPQDRLVVVSAWALPLGVLAQALLGGVTVLTGLSPYTVAAHFLLSMVLISFAALLVERLTAPPDTPASRGIQHATTALLVIGFVVLLLGTIVTGAGPHGGDLGAPRFGVDIRFVAIAHADAVWALVGLTIGLVAVTWRSGSLRLRRALRVLLAIQVVQGGIGYAQYALGIPAELVSLHILGAAIMWAAATFVWARARPTSFQAPGLPSHDATAGDAEPDAVVAG